MSDSGGGPALARHDFPKKDRVRTRAEIDRVFSAGSRYSCKGMRLHVLATEGGSNRLAIAPVRSYPGSVARNRAKRLLRESWRLLKHSFISFGHDCVIVVYPGSDTLEERRSQLQRLLAQAHLTGGA